MTLARLLSQVPKPALPAAGRRFRGHARSAQRILPLADAGRTRCTVAHGFREWSDKATWSKQKQKPQPEPRRLSSADGARSAAPRSTHYRLAGSTLLCMNTTSSHLCPTLLEASPGRHSHQAASPIRFFSGSAPASATMAATKIDGTAIAKKIRERLRAEIAQVKETNPRFRPSLKIIQGSCLFSSRARGNNMVIFA